MLLRIESLWREPLLHFLLLGFALFLYYDLTTGDVDGPPRHIRVERGQVQQLVASFERTWSRPPTAEELGAMVDGYVREEVFYREALAMGLDRDDPIVRRRMRMKLEFILEDLTPQDVSDAVLDDFLQQNADDFRSEAQVSFRLVYLDPGQRADLPSDAARLLAALNGGANEDEVGDSTLAPRIYQRARQSEIERDFGEELAREVVALPPGAWHGPVYSPFGAHLLKIDERIEARLPPLAEIRDDVLRDYLSQERQRQKDLAYERLREGYDVTAEPLGAEVGGSPFSATAGEAL